MANKAAQKQQKSAPVVPSKPVPPKAAPAKSASMGATPKPAEAAKGKKK